MTSLTISVNSDSQLPEKTDVVIAGGGIIGASTAWFLSQKNIPVVLCKKAKLLANNLAETGGFVVNKAETFASYP